MVPSAGTGGSSCATTTTTPSTTWRTRSRATSPACRVDKGYAIADRIHNSGQAMVWAGQKEPAELYWELLNDAGLTMAPLEQG